MSFIYNVEKLQLYAPHVSHLIMIYLLAVGTNVSLDSPQKLTFPSGGKGQFLIILPADPSTSQGRVHGDDVGATGQPWHFRSLSTYGNED